MSKFTVMEDFANHRVVLFNRPASNYIVVKGFGCDKVAAYDYAMRLNAVEPKSFKTDTLTGAGSPPPRMRPKRNVTLNVPIIVTSKETLGKAKPIFDTARVCCMNKDWLTAEEVAKTTKMKDSQVRTVLMKNFKGIFKRRMVRGKLEFAFKDPKLIVAAVELINKDHLQQRDLFRA